MRIEIDDRRETLGKKIREHQLQKVQLMPEQKILDHSLLQVVPTLLT